MAEPTYFDGIPTDQTPLVVPIETIRTVQVWIGDGHSRSFNLWLLKLSHITRSSSDHFPGSLKVDIMLMNLVSEQSERRHFDCLRSEKDFKVRFCVREEAMRRFWWLFCKALDLLEELSVFLAPDKVDHRFIRLPC